MPSIPIDWRNNRAATPAELRNIVETYVGPMILKTDDTVAQKEPTSAEAEVGIRGSIVWSTPSLNEPDPNS